MCRIAKKLVYGKIRGALGVSKCVVSGGGSLQPHLDEFYEILDLTVLNGWGLSEVQPILILVYTHPDRPVVSSEY